MDARREEFLAAGLVYPPGPDGQHGLLLYAIGPDWNPAELRKVVDNANARGASKLVLSAEAVTMFPPEALRKLADCFADCDLSFIFAFRHWAGYLPSRWAQYSRRRDAQSFPEFLEKVVIGRRVDYQFDLLLERAISAASGRVRAISFDWAVARDGSVLPTLLSVLGIDDGALLTAAARHHWAHRNTDPELVEITRLVHGAMSARFGVAPDELFDCAGAGKRCETIYQAHQAVREIPRELREAVTALGRGSAVERSFAADWDPPAAGELERYRGLFVNLPDDRLFPPRKPSAAHYWTIGHAEALTVPGMRGFVDRVAEKILSGRQPGARLTAPAAHRTYATT
ncbi:hypothetical protein [Mesorhizobium sp. J428]|uniref:hypothetical protein n=1 Tax=Mesorhizobium sp. J428 TaxID=2898440 RepID=UPI002150A30F|nr:hypothetical protein [Mesorhizobium sp. J428]MCR5856051.1 hypothetical protein [Mesorhizobium sp. J428]